MMKRSLMKVYLVVRLMMGVASFVTFTATVMDANGNQGVATSTFQLTDSAANGQELTPQPNQ